VCGDGVHNAFALNTATQEGTDIEACDTSENTATCDSDCTAPACGDGICNLAAGECDVARCTTDCTSCP
jgi:hypothetical protein